MPNGYIASALLTVVPVKAGKFTVLSVFGRQVYTSPVILYSGSQSALGFDIPVSGIVPLNTRSISGMIQQSSTLAGFLSIGITSGKT
ncbi:hypothetical protein F9U41_23430, partial [Pectobacterium versatile]|nr:hypothetical protein [Pectobacterium versatile]